MGKRKNTKRCDAFMPPELIEAMDRAAERRAVVEMQPVSRSDIVRIAVVALLKKDGISIRPRRTRRPQAQQAETLG
jgi:hypothetical protein